jgi:glycosidase
VAKGQLAPSEILSMYEYRRQVENGVLSTHGDASNFFVTFLDTHDQNWRFFYRDPQQPDAYDDQVSLGVGCLFSLPGIPCLYYGTEQGLAGGGSSSEYVREALWGKPKPSRRTASSFKLFSVSPWCVIPSQPCVMAAPTRGRSQGMGCILASLPLHPES